jgi:hypothetical protein
MRERMNRIIFLLEQRDTTSILSGEVANWLVQEALPLRKWQP